MFLGFPGGSESNELARNAGDLGEEESPEEGMATHASTLAWRTPMAGCSPWGRKESDATGPTAQA